MKRLTLIWLGFRLFLLGIRITLIQNRMYRKFRKYDNFSHPVILRLSKKNEKLNSNWEVLQEKYNSIKPKKEK